MLKAKLTSLFLLCFYFTNAQSYSISGVVADSIGEPASFASISLADPIDSSTIAFAISKEDGSFEFKGVKKGEYTLITARMGYLVNYFPISINADKKNIQIILKHTSKSFDEVMVSAAKIPMLINGDTVVYNASTFKTKTNANVEDLIKKLPGVKLNRDGTIVSEGQNVTKILINGKEFFGGNLEAATKNLDADLVDKLEIIDRKTAEDEFTGTSDEQREKVINLVLKEEKTNGYFGTIRAGYGADDYYRGSGNINFFSGSTQLSIIGGGNNVNQSLYGWKAMQTLNSFEISPFNSSTSMSWWGQGIKTYAGIGANLHLSPSEKMEFDVAYVYGNEATVGLTERNSEVYLTNSTLLGTTESSNISDNSYHQLNFKAQLKPDSFNQIVIRTQAKTDASDGFRNSQTINSSLAKSILNSGVNKDDNSNNTDDITSKIHWTRKHKKKKESYFVGSVYAGGSDISNLMESYFKTDTTLLPWPTTESPLLSQVLNTQERTLALTAAYEYKINNKWKIRPGVNAMGTEYQHSFKWREADGSLLPNKSPVGSVTAYNMEYFAHFIYKLDSFTSIRFVPEINQNLEKREFTTDSITKQDINQIFFIPYLFIRSNKAHKYGFRFNVSSRMHRPQVLHILPVVDNSNPYSTTVGNMSLQNYMSYSNNWSYQRILGLGKSLTFSGWSSLSIKPIGTISTITEENYSLSQYANFKHRLYSNHDVEFVLPINAIKALVGLEVDFGYSRNYFSQNGKEILADQNSIGIGPSIQFNQWDKFNLEGDYNISYSNGSIDGVANNPYLGHEIDFSASWQPVERFEINSTLDWSIYGRNSTVGVQSIPIISSSINFFVDKDKKWSVGAEAFDILDKNQNLWRWWSGNSFVESRSNAVRRYIMGTITYKIAKPKPKSKEEDLE